MKHKQLGCLGIFAMLTAMAVACKPASLKMAGSSSSGASDQTGTSTENGDLDATAIPSTSTSTGASSDASAGKPNIAIKANGSADDLTVTASTDVTISWSSVDTTDCTVSPLSANGTSGSQVVNIKDTTTYTVQCSTGAGSVTDSITVYTTPAVAPTAAIKANGKSGSITASPNDSVTISWESQNADQCTVSPSGSTGTKGSVVVTVGGKATLYVVSCEGPGGTIQDTVAINVGSAATLQADLKANGTDVALRVAHGSTVNLSWTSTGAKSCELSPLNDTRLQGSVTTASLTSPVVFALACENAGTSIIDAIAIDVAAPTNSLVDLKINGSDGPLIVAAGQTITITWTSTGAKTCSLLPDVDGSSTLASSGSLTTTATGSLVSYTMTCQGVGGEGSDSVIVMPQVATPTATLTANGSRGLISVHAGSTINLAWTSTAASNCTVNPGSYSGVSGTATTGPIYSRTDFVLLCRGPYGEASSTVTVIPAHAALTVALTVNGSSKRITVRKNTALSVAWTSSAATSCNVAPWGYTGVSGSKTVAAVTGSLTVTLICTDSSGFSQTASVPVDVITTADTASIDLKVNGQDSALYIDDERPVQLVWTSQGTSSCVLDGTKSVPTNGSMIKDITRDTQVTVVCQTLAGGSVTDSVSIYLRRGGVVTTQIGINFEDQKPGSRDSDFNDFNLCGYGGQFTIYNNEVVSNKAQTVLFTTSKRSSCDHLIEIDITHANGTKDKTISFYSSKRPSTLSLNFKAGSKLHVAMTPYGDCSPKVKHSMLDPLWAIVKHNECRCSGI